MSISRQTSAVAAHAAPAPFDRPVRAWQRMLSGRRLDLLDPDPADVEIADIAHGLARVARWNGQTVGPHAFSVAQHAVIVEEIAVGMAASAEHVRTATDGRAGWDANCRRAALLHDAAEYVIGDLISPFKSAIGLDYKAFELRLMAAIHTRFGLPPQLPGDVALAIKQADQIAAYYEATRLAGFSEDEAATYFGRPSGLPDGLMTALDGLTAVPAETAQRMFFERFEIVAVAYDGPN